MSRTYRKNSKDKPDGRGGSRRQSSAGPRGRRVSVRAVRRSEPDLARLGRAVLAIAMAQAEADAQAEAAPAAADESTTEQQHRTDGGSHAD